MRNITRDVTYDPETVAMLAGVLDEAWNCLSRGRREKISKSDLASRILGLAADGERDPVRLWAHAISETIH